MFRWLGSNERYLFAMSAIVGIICGSMSNYGFLEGRWGNLVLWGLVGVFIGVCARTLRGASITGSLYGFFLVMSFLYVGYQGSAESIPSFILLSVFLSLLGSACGVVCAIVGKRISRLFISSS